MPKVAIDQQAPEFSLKDVSGSEIRLAKFQNQTNVLLVFNRGFM